MGRRGRQEKHSACFYIVFLAVDAEVKPQDAPDGQTRRRRRLARKAFRLLSLGVLLVEAQVWRQDPREARAAEGVRQDKHFAQEAPR